MAEKKMKILVVDDEPNNITVIREILKDLYNIAPAPNGEKALQIATKLLPDIILLDIMMPGMDGFEVCRRLKKNPDTRDIPIIFITAMSEVQNEAEGFEVGCVDYIRKPVQPDILKARVGAQLAVIEKNSLKEDVERITRHDLKSPLNGIINYPPLIKSEGNLSEKQLDKLEKITKLGRNMLRMINLSLDMYKMEQGTYTMNSEMVNLVDILSEVKEESRIRLKVKRLTVDILIDGAPATESDQFILQGEKLLMYSMLSNLFKNSVEASPKDERITMEMKHAENYSVSIHNMGDVPEEIRDTFFDKYATAGKSGGTGLGTYSAKLIAETLGGQISLDSSETNETTIQILFQG
jgi:two-component system sensor histidine kinase/response regulator